MLFDKSSDGAFVSMTVAFAGDQVIHDALNGTGGVRGTHLRWFGPEGRGTEKGRSPEVLMIESIWNMNLWCAVGHRTWHVEIFGTNFENVNFSSIRECLAMWELIFLVELFGLIDELL